MVWGYDLIVFTYSKIPTHKPVEVTLSINGCLIKNILNSENIVRVKGHHPLHLRSFMWLLLICSYSFTVKYLFELVARMTPDV